MSLHAIIALRQTAFFNPLKADPFQPVQVETVEDLRRHAFLDDLELEVTVEKSGRRSLWNAVVVRRASDPDGTSSV